MHPEEKTLMDKEASKLLEKASDCFDVAETQLHVAEVQRGLA
jgi:hypothetical protein